MLKYFLALFLLSTCAIAFSPTAQLGPKECLEGPSFWCNSIKNAKDCNAVKHCIQTDWEMLSDSARDDDNICNLCKAMVNDARNQLESNETLDMIKDVFQRSCKLMVLKPIVRQCIKFADEYAVELVDMLDSYMSPDVICILAGLCGGQDFTPDIPEEKLREQERDAELQKDCQSCLEFGEYMRSEACMISIDSVMIYFKDRCSYLGSYTYACAEIIEDFVPSAYRSLLKDYTPASFCHLISACINNHGDKHPKEITSTTVRLIYDGKTLSVPKKAMTDDQVCELCKTMAQRVVDILVRNTTALEFKQMMMGICGQTGRFKDECEHLVSRYYDQIYHALVNDFKPGEWCNFLDLCDPRAGINRHILAPYFPISYPPIITLRDPASPPMSPLPLESEFPGDDDVPGSWKLIYPIDTMNVSEVQDLEVNNRESCVLCQYLLHYIQKMISQPYGENELKKIVDKVCDDLPESVTLQCKNFVEEFGDAFVAILAQEIDPSQVCPALRACPSTIVNDEFVPSEIGGAPECPLCLMAVEDITEKLKDNKTEDAIRKALHSLCERMSKNLRPQCNEFVQKYTEEVVDMMLADFTPQEVCTYLKLCHTKVHVELVAPHPEEKHEILTNEIPRGEGEGKVKVEAKVKKVEAVEKKNNQPACFLCEFVMDKVKDQLKGNETEEEVRRIVLGACKSIPKAIESDCRDFVSKYSKYIVEMLENDVDPRMVCREMHMCKEQKEPAHLDHVFRAVEECAICEALVGAIRGLLEDKNFDRNMSRYAVQICYSIPFLKPYQMDRCKSMVLSYGPSIINLLVELEVRPELVCSRLELCDETEQAKVHLIESSTEVTESHPQLRPHLLGGNSCTWGPSYWCQSEDHAKECGTLAHCREVVWKADRPTPAA